MSNSSLPLGELPCHFTWKELRQENAGRTLKVNFEELEEHIQETIEGTEVESYNLMGYYKTEMGRLDEAECLFKKALNHCKVEDQKIVVLGNIAWLKDICENQMLTCSVEEDIEEIVKRIVNGRNVQNIPEVMAEKAFAIANGGFTESGFIQAYSCVNLALENHTNNVVFMFTKAIVMKKLYRKRVTPFSKCLAVQEIQENWKKIIANVDPKNQVKLHQHALIEYAMFLNKINWNNGRKYAEHAEKLCTVASHVIMRNLAEFYLQSAKHDGEILQKAEDILDAILKVKPNCPKTLHLRGLLFTDKYQFAAREGKEEIFEEAKCCLYTAWKENEKIFSPALDLVQLYVNKYKDTEEQKLLLDAENLFKEMLQVSDKMDRSIGALVHEKYGKFLRLQSSPLAFAHESVSRVHSHPG